MVATARDAARDAANDIPVATVDAPRRRDDEVLPEHETQWPATEAVQALIRERYDGTSSTSHAIGEELHSPPEWGSRPYPSWRIQQIARQLGLAEEKRDEIIARIRAQETTEKVTMKRPAIPATTSTTTPTPMQGAMPLTCERCGATFTPWRVYKGRPSATKPCHECFRISIAKNYPRDARTETAEPAATPAATPAREPGWVDVLPAPAFITPATGPAQPAIMDCPLDGPDDDDDDAELTFGDLPGAGAVFQLLDLLPTDGRWTTSRRRKWYAAFTATLDLLVMEVAG